MAKRVDYTTVALVTLHGLLANSETHAPAERSAGVLQVRRSTEPQH